MQGKIPFAIYVVMSFVGVIPLVTTKMCTGPQVASVILVNAVMHAVFWAYFRFFAQTKANEK